MSLLKLAAEQNEKEKSKASQYARNGLLLGAGVGAASGVNKALGSYDETVRWANKAKVKPPSAGAHAAKSVAGSLPRPVVGLGLAGLGAGAIADGLKKPKRKKDKEGADE